MTRTTAREIAVQLSFALAAHPEDEVPMLEQFFDRAYFATLAKEDPLFAEYPDKKQLRYILRLTAGVREKQAELDGYIEKYAVGWSVSRISRMAKCILRLSMYEMLYMQIPVGASVNEALELCKRYESPETASFLNGVLASFVQKELTA